MKTMLLIIIGMVVSSFVIPQGFSQCIYNEDWPNAPCFDMGSVNKLEYQLAWAPYYLHKGSELMESKKIEMNQALHDGVLEEWTRTLENNNVYSYYRSTGEIQSQFPYDVTFVENSISYHLEILILSSPIIATSLIIIFVIRRKRK